MTISLRPFTRVMGYQTIKVTGYPEKRPLQALINTEITYNFINQEVTKKLGCNVLVLKLNNLLV